MNRRLLLAQAGMLVIASSSAFSQERAASTADAASDEVGQKYVIYDDNASALEPSGWMPDGKGIAADVKSKDRPYSGQFCTRYQFNPAKQPERWVGVAYLHQGKWLGPKFDLFKAIGAKKGDAIVVRFFARSATESTARFEFGGGEGASMAFPAEIDWVKLPREWRRFEFNLTDQDLSKIGKSFTWVMDEDHQDNPDTKVHELEIDRIYVTRVTR